MFPPAAARRRRHARRAQARALLLASQRPLVSRFELPSEAQSFAEVFCPCSSAACARVCAASCRSPPAPAPGAVVAARLLDCWRRLATAPYVPHLSVADIDALAAPASRVASVVTLVPSLRPVRARSFALSASALPWEPLSRPAPSPLAAAAAPGPPFPPPPASVSQPSPAAASGAAAAPFESAESVLARLLHSLPAAAPAALVSDRHRASARRLLRKPQELVRKKGGGAYVLQRAPLRVYGGELPASSDLRRCDQCSPADVVAAIRADSEAAAAHGVPRHVLPHMVDGALRRRARALPVDPQADRGSCPMPSSLRASAVAEIIVEAGFSYPTFDDIVYGLDTLDGGGPRYSHAPNHGSAAPYLEELELLFLDQERRGILVDVTRTLRAAPLIPHNVIPLGVVLKASGKARPISDASSYGGPNIQTDPTLLLPARMTGSLDYARMLWDLRQRLGPSASIMQQVHDLSDAFTSHPVRAQDALRYVFQVGDRFYAPMRGLFGQRVPGFHCCSLTTAIARRTVTRAAAAGIDAAAAPWVDDTIVAAEAARIDAVSALQLANTRGVGYVDAVDKLGPAAEATDWIGLRWDTRAMRVSLTEKRLESVLAASASVAGAHKMRLSDLQGALGVIDAAAAAVPSLGAFCAAARKCASVAEGTPRSHFVGISAAARAEAVTWGAIAAASPGASLMPREVRAVNAPSSYSDACTEYGFGFYIPELGLYCSEPWPLDALAAHGTPLLAINALEQLASYLSFAAAEAAPGGALSASHRALFIYTDNMANRGATRKLGSSSAAMSLFTRAFALLSARTDVLPLPLYLPGRLHVQADALSRGIIPPCFLQAPWRRVRFSPATLLELLTSAAPWTVAVEPLFS